MLATGIRTPVGVKVIGQDLKVIEGLAREIEIAIKTVPGTSSAFAERIMGGYYLEIEPERRELARYGLMVGDVQQAIAREVLVPLANGASIPLGQVASVRLVQGPASIRTENAQLAAYIFVDARDRDLGGYVADAKQAVASAVNFPPGYYAIWSGQFEYYERAKQRLGVVIPLTLIVVFLLLYLNFQRLAETLIVMLSLPFALVGGLWLMWWMGFNLSVAVAVGFSVAAETGVIMLIYLEHALEEHRRRAAAEGRDLTRRDLYAAIMDRAVERVRPKMMTVVAIMAGLLPILWSHGTGSEVMQRIAVPMIGGMVSSTILTLVVIPAIYALVKQAGLGGRR